MTLNGCACGCGGRTRYRFIRGHYQRTVPRRSGYKQALCPARGVMDAHVLIAEAALGRRLPAGAEVHHVDGNRQNNDRANLVICEDCRYHRLLHARTRIVAAGGNPNTDAICRACKRAKPLDAFATCSSNGATHRQGLCRTCMKDYDAKRFLARHQ